MPTQSSGTDHYEGSDPGDPGPLGPSRHADPLTAGWGGPWADLSRDTNPADVVDLGPGPPATTLMIVGGAGTMRSAGPPRIGRLLSSAVAVHPGKTLAGGTV